MPVTNYVKEITAEQAEKLRFLLEQDGWELDDAPYALYRARKNKTTCVAYESGKLVIQGKGTEELVQFTLEPQVLEEARLGYEAFYAMEEQPEMFQPHAGIDESGKGDFFGPLVIAACYVNEESARALFEAGVQDSKNIKSDKKILGFDEQIRAAVGGKFAVVRIGNAAYNRMYSKMHNVNRILAWGHARALENLLDKQPDCPRALSDQFGRKSSVLKALMDRGKRIKLEQRPRAEADIAVAAASILARAEFVRQLQAMAERLEIEDLVIPRGASKKVVEIAVDLVRQKGPSVLPELVKLHFKTTAAVRAQAGIAGD